MINNNVKKQYPVIRMPNGHPISATMYNRGDLHGVVYSNDIEFDDVLLSNVITTSTVVANLNVSTTVSSNILSSGLLLGTVTVSKLVNSTISTTSNITADVKLAYNLLSSLTTSSSVVGNLTIPKLVNTSLVSTGTIVADLSVTSGSAIDADAAAFFARVTAAGGTLTTTEQNAVNTLVVQMKADGIWDKMKAIYPMVGGGQANPAAACAQNLKSASFTGTFSSGWTFANTGVTPNGTSAFMNTNLQPNVIMSFNSQSYSFYRGNTNTKGAEYGVNQTSSLDNYGIAFFPVSNYTYINRFITDARFSGGVNAGYYIMNLNGSNFKTFKNNNTINSATLAPTNYTLNSIYLGGRNQMNAGTIRDTSDSNCRFFHIGDALTDTEANNLNIAVQAFQTTLNRQV